MKTAPLAVTQNFIEENLNYIFMKIATETNMLLDSMVIIMMTYPVDVWKNKLLHDSNEVCRSSFKDFIIRFIHKLMQNMFQIWLFRMIVLN